MSYMGNYVMWLTEEGLSGMQHVERYHKENPHMIPKSRVEVVKDMIDNYKEEPIIGQHQDYEDN